MKKRTGFTLMELLIVFAIIAILAGAIVGALRRRAEEAKRGKAMAEMHEILSACNAFYADTGRWALVYAHLTATQWNNGWRPYNDAMQMEQLPDPSTYKGPYLEFETPGGAMIDPWGWGYQIRVNRQGTDIRAQWVFSFGFNPIKDDDDLWLLVHRFD